MRREERFLVIIRIISPKFFEILIDICDKRIEQHTVNNTSEQNNNIVVVVENFNIFLESLGFFLHKKRKKRTIFNANFNICMNQLIFQITFADIPKHWLPSVLRIFELSVQGNVLFRIITIIPIALRLFHSYITQARNSLEKRCNNPIYWLCNIVAPYFLFVELISCALFSIITIRHDFPGEALPVIFDAIPVDLINFRSIYELLYIELFTNCLIILESRSTS